MLWGWLRSAESRKAAAMEQHSVEIRRAEESDLPAMCLLLDQFLGRRPGSSMTHYRDALAVMLADQARSLVIVAVLKGRVLGMGTMQTLFSTTMGGQVGLIDDVVVDKDHHSRGIGRALVSTLIKSARHSGLQRLQCQVVQGADRALQFFAAQGWRATDYVCLSMLDDPMAPSSQQITGATGATGTSGPANTPTSDSLAATGAYQRVRSEVIETGGYPSVDDGRQH